MSVSFLCRLISSICIARQLRASGLVSEGMDGVLSVVARQSAGLSHRLLQQPPPLCYPTIFMRFFLLLLSFNIPNKINPDVIILYPI